MMFFDTHCHLDFNAFDTMRQDVLDRCQQVGVQQILLPGVTKSNWQKVIDLAGSDRRFCIALGLHPCFMSQHVEEDLTYLSDLLKNSNIVAVGEIGLDFWELDVDKERQLRFLDTQLELAVDHHLPVILHSRKSHDVLLSRLKRKGAVSGVVHGFSGSWQQAINFVDQGLKLGIGGAVTYPRAKKLRDIVSRLPVESLVLETDSPGMPLCGKQGQINRPDYLPEVFEVVRELRSESKYELAEKLWDNSQRLFSKVY